MDNPEKMDQSNQGSSSSVAIKRKRGRPRRDEGETQQQLNPSVTTTFEESMIGRVVSGVVEGSFEAGYFLNVKVAETEKELRGIVFLPGKVTPVTPTTDLFPQAKMYAREDIPLSSLRQQAPPLWKKNASSQTDDVVSEPQTDKLIADRNQSATLPDIHPVSDECVVGSVAIDERIHHPTDTEMKDVNGSSTADKLTDPEGQTLSLMPQFGGGDAPKEDNTVLRSEACGASKTAITVTTSTTSPKDSYAKGSITFVDFFPAPEMNPKQATGSSSSLSLELFQNETNRSGTEEEESTKDAETRGMDEKTVSPADDVPEELQLELGNKKMGVSAIATETNPDQSASSKGGFLALFDGRGVTSKNIEETNADSETIADSESGFPEETTTQVDANDS